jgi:hypothetical protein
VEEKNPAASNEGTPELTPHGADRIISHSEQARWNIPAMRRAGDVPFAEGTTVGRVAEDVQRWAALRSLASPTGFEPVLPP